MDASFMERIALSAYRTCEHESGWPQLLEEIRIAVGARSAILHTPYDGPRMMIGSPEFTREIRERFVSMPVNPWVDRLNELGLSRPTGVCRVGSSYLPMSDLQRSGFFELVDKSMHIGPLATLYVEGDDAQLSPRTSLVVVRGPRDRDFTEDTAQMLQAVHAPLRAAVRSYWALQRMRQLECATEMAYQALPQPVFVLRGDGGIEYANPAADALLIRGDLLASAEGRLVRAGALGRESVQLLLSAASRGLVQQVTIRGAGDAAVPAGVLHLTRLPPHTAFETRWPPGSILATLQLRPVDGTEAKMAVLARRCRLTSAEAQVLHEVSSGASAKEIAERRHVRLSTVRTQIRGLLEKTRARRQSDLIRMLLD